MERTCKKCGETKPIKEFKEGRNKCKRCYIEYTKNYVKTHSAFREKLLAYHKEYRRKRREEKLKQRSATPTKKEKTCKKCHKTLPIDKFETIRSGIRNGKQRYSHANRCIDCINDNKLYKTCPVCKEKLPRTEEYFYTRTHKQQNKSGDAVYYSYKHACKKCLCSISSTRHRVEYWENPERARAELRRKYWKDPIKARVKTNEWRQKNVEYSLTKDRKRVAELDDSWVASLMKIPLSEIPKADLELRKLTIMLKREAGLTHSTKKHMSN